MYFARIVGLSLVLQLYMAFPVFAYVDPGSGAMLIQAVLALFTSVLFYICNPRKVWERLKDWFFQKRER